MSPRRQEPTRGKLLDATLVPPTKRRATSPLPAALREDVIELLSRLLLADLTARVISQGLDLLGIQTIEQM